MFCQRCGNEVPDGSSFCGSCGADLGATTPLAAIRELAQQSEIDLVKEALKGDYEIIKELGRGGMAIVYHAREIMLDREVALKVLPFSLAFDEEFVERFQREARTSARLEHPHIIPVYRVGKVDNVIFFSMKFLKGSSLAEVIEAKGKLPASDIRKLLIESASALGYAHKNDIVHRDIKPDNVMFKENGDAVVCDFGIAKAASGTKLTGTGMAIGTPYYMSPEQARAQPLDGRSDLYSLGVLAYQCLTGSVPFDGEDSFAIGYKHIMEDLPVPDLQGLEEKALFEVIRKMMAKDPDDRFQKAEELVLMLSDGGPTAQALPVISSPEPATEILPNTAGAGDKTTPLNALPAIEDVETGPAPAATGSKPTPLTPMPRESMEAGTVKKKSKVPVLVGALVVLLGGGGGGAYYYTQVMGGTLPGIPSGEQVAAEPESETDPAANDPVVLASNDSTAAAPDSTPTADTTATATPADTTSAPAAPTTGVLALVGLANDAQVFLNDMEVDGARQRLSPGQYNLRVVRPGYDEYSSRIAIAAGDTLQERVATRRTPVVSTPPPEDRRPPPPEPEPAGPTTQCDTFNDTYNLDGSCFDDRPRLDPSVSPFVQLPSNVQATGGIELVIQVMANGTAGYVGPVDPSGINPDFLLAAMQYAKDVRYVAAVKNGQTVDAWLRQIFYAQNE